MANYNTEREGQLDFFKTFLPLINPNLSLDDILADDNDGVLNGNLLEFKLRVNDLNAVLFQCVKYMSALRIKGKPVPANVIIVDLNAEQAYFYRSVDYLTDIEKVYEGGASKANVGFIGQPYLEKYAYGADQLAVTKLIARLKQNEFTQIHIDENCIVGWATAFYKAVPTARKEDFIGDDTGKHKTIGEIRNPSVFAEYIYPYTGATNVKFQYLMDKLNDTLQKKNLGAFYTPEAYAEKSHELLRMAIDRVPTGNDYVIIDRCAGTGNLEKGLTDEELSHCILSTVEYYEYKVMQEILGSKVRHIIPPVEAADTFQAGLVKGADALSKEFVENPIIKQYIDDPNCTIILFENPPYAETTSLEHQRTGAGKKSSAWKRSFVVSEMKKQVKGAVLNDLGNVFIWSAFEYYIRQSTDSYVVYSPVKYWKSQHLVDNEFLAGFAFNRRHFHTNIDACIMVALWGGDVCSDESINLEGFDIEPDGNLSKPVSVPVNKVHDLFSTKYYEKGQFADESFDGILIGLNGLEAKDDVKKRIKPFYSDEMLGYMVADSVGFDNPDAKSSLLVAGRYNGNGFYVRKDNYLEKLPMFCASRYINYNREWTERARIMKSGDGADRFNADVSSGKLDQWLRKCLLFTCVEMQNHMRTFTGSDGRFYRNELCMDTTNGETLASEDLKQLVCGEDEKRIIAQWNVLLDEAKKTAEYDSNLTYGVYQIFAEIDTSYKDDEGKTVWNNLEVHSALQTLKTLVKDYYNKEIVPMLFEYEFLK
ncbi:hypothetical protein [Clostridium facile]|uniref:Site-specific DNA-methyltransferase (adenine-specific) n=1 Tax=Clostridium facile TaxID=2763035 RepID=A0ABR7IPN3_9CLOT|nr:hypothetical protein [Clostridium facile]MBC5787088.1 hypothetical protein [Clostridium facile]